MKVKTKYVTAGYGDCGPKMFVLIMYRTEHGSWKVEVSPCDSYGSPISDPVAWDIFLTWWEARKYFKQQYREFNRYVNER